MTEEATAAQPITEYNVLFADTFSYRHTQIRIRAGSSKRVVVQRHCHTAGELIYTVKQKKWDVVFIPGYFDKKDEAFNVIRAICTLPDNMKPNLIVFHGTDDQYNCVKQFRNVGILATHIPWDFTSPMEHVRKESKQPGDFFGRPPSLQQSSADSLRFSKGES